MSLSLNVTGIVRPAIQVRQPLGTFYAFSLKANVLNQVTYSQPAEVMERLERDSEERRGGYSIFGTQRGEKRGRLDEIASFIQSSEATFPNAIILAANYDLAGRYQRDEKKRWRVDERDKNSWKLTIPSLKERSASIIDGQHRLHAFERLPVDAPHHDMELLCVVFLELPTPYHAYVFATINFNQKKVDRSLAYELFGFDVDEKPSKLWATETLAVYLARLLNTDEKSPLYRCIAPASGSENLFDEDSKPSDGIVRVSMATIVDGILRLLSQNPREDRYFIRRPENLLKGRRALTPIEGLPLRTLYLESNDVGIYDLICHFFKAVRATVWEGSGEGSYLFKTVGIQALFDVLRILLLVTPIGARSYSVKALTERFEPCRTLDPDGTKYEASGIGRSEIRAELLEALDLTAATKLAS